MSTLLDGRRGSAVGFGGVQAVQGFSFDVEVPAHKVFALIGPNGAGKTTVINMLTGLLAPTRRGVSVFAAAEHYRPRRSHRIAAAGIARTYQNGRLFARLTVRENVLAGGHHLLGQGVFSGIFGGGQSSHRHGRDLAASRGGAARHDFFLADGCGGAQRGQPALWAAAAGGDRAGTGRRSRRCCCSTSRPRGSIQPRGQRGWSTYSMAGLRNGGGHDDAADRAQYGPGHAQPPIGSPC